MKKFVLLFFYLIYNSTSFSQIKECGTEEYNRLLADRIKLSGINNKQQPTQSPLSSPEKQIAFKTVSNGIIHIPVVVHVVYRTLNESISDAQIQSQIAVLNKDFRKLNTDTNLIPAPWKTIAADCQIEFCLATKDPQGNPSTGIRYRKTTKTSFSISNEVKYTAQGGDDAWDASQYLNLWVCNLGTALYGYAQYPNLLAGSPLTDGVVINYFAFGTNGSAVTPSNKGRTTTHEIGHWLNLIHIWGDDGNSCSGTDSIADTPNQRNSVFYCTSTFPKTDLCSNTYPGIMFNNYMDYGDDPCLFFFTEDQKTRMRNAITYFRPSFLTQTICTGPSSIEQISKVENIAIYPNPSSSLININTSLSNIEEIVVYDLLGNSILNQTNMQTTATQIDLSANPNAIYFIAIKTSLGYYTRKVLINK